MSTSTLTFQPRLDSDPGDSERIRFLRCFSFLRNPETSAVSAVQSPWQQCDWDVRENTVDWVFLAKESEPSFWSTAHFALQKHFTYQLQACVSVLAVQAKYAALPHNFVTWPDLKEWFSEKSREIINSLPPAIVDNFPSVPPQLQEPVRRAVDIVASTIGGRVQMPEIEYDREDPSALWITIPVKCQGDVSRVLVGYQQAVKKLVSVLSPEEQQHIRIDLIAE